MKKYILLFAVAALIFGSCKKQNIDAYQGDTKPTATVTLYGKAGGLKSTNGQIINSGGVMSGPCAFPFLFWLEPSQTAPVATGIFHVVDSVGNVIFHSSSAENIINNSGITFQHSGHYTLSVSGSYGGTPFSFTGITVWAMPSGVNPTNYHPISINSLSANGANYFLDISMSRAEYAGMVSTWFYVNRINGTNFMKVPASLNGNGDSIRFTMTGTIPTGSDLLELNGGYNDGTPGGVWFNASTYNSMLYVGPNNYFAMTVEKVGNTLNLKAPNGTIITSCIINNNPSPIPGNGGDGAPYYYLRFAGYRVYSNTGSGTWYRCQLDNNPASLIQGVSWGNGFFYFDLPSGTSATVYLETGTIVNGAFIPMNNMSHSGYYVASMGKMVFNI